MLVLAACGDDGGGAPVHAAADGAVDAASDAATDAAIVGGGAVGSPDCAPGGSHGPDHVGSGSRLRARFHVAAGGARSFDAFHDDVLDLDCRFEQPDEVAGTPLGGPPSTGAPYWPRGALHNGPVYLRVPPQPCFAATPGTPLYRLGARIELADLAVLTPQFQ